MGAFRDPSTINNVGAVGSTTNPMTGSALGMDRENQKAIKELIGTLDWESLMILDGGITPVSSEIIVDTEDGTPADDLTTINLTSDGTTTLHTGMRIKIKSADPSRVITVKHLTGGGNIRTADGRDVVLSNDWSLDFKLQNDVWVEQKVRTDGGWMGQGVHQVEPFGYPTSVKDITNQTKVIRADSDDNGVSQYASGVHFAALNTWGRLRVHHYVPSAWVQGGVASAGTGWTSRVVLTDNLLQTTGQSTEFPMSQKAVTDALKDVANKEYVKASKYELCEFYFWRHPILKPGFMPAHGGILENVATLYPEAWAYLHSEEGQLLCTTEPEWQAMTRAVWHTNADGTQVGWNGIGGAPFYVLDVARKRIRLPDLRGMYAEAAGFDSLGVGEVHGDAVRNIIGDPNYLLPSAFGNPSGAFQRYSGYHIGVATSGSASTPVVFDAKRVTPVANKVQPRAYGVLACVYLGIPR